jgi:hypothetical protein
MLSMIFVLSSWVMVKHVTLLTELTYFDLSSVPLFSLCLFYRQE